MPEGIIQDGRRRIRSGTYNPYRAGQVFDYATRARVNEQLRRRYELSMGPTWRPPSTGQPPRQSIPTMVPRTAQNPQGLLPTTDRRDIPPPYQTNLSEAPLNLSSILSGITDIASTYYDIRNIRSGGPPRAIMGATPPYVPAAGPVRTSPIAAGVVGGLGNIVRTGLWDEVWDWGVDAAGDVYDWATGDDAPPGLPAPGTFSAPITRNGGGQMACGELNPANVVYKWDCATQQYTPRKKYRRRRKRLASKSDIKDLASLKGIVGQGKVMETWIATHC